MSRRGRDVRRLRQWRRRFDAIDESRDHPRLRGTVVELAARAWNESRGNRFAAMLRARRELSEAGFGVIEIVTIIYYLIRIWQLIRDEWGEWGETKRSVRTSELAQLMEDFE